MPAHVRRSEINAEGRFVPLGESATRTYSVAGRVSPVYIVVEHLKEMDFVVHEPGEVLSVRIHWKRHWLYLG
ncbi:MAG: hypothetical protein H6963_12300 [Chromatiaceae bacterium]|nr:hypothetical protein [Chromatiaceae bacterium]